MKNTWWIAAAVVVVGAVALLWSYFGDHDRAPAPTEMTDVRVAQTSDFLLYAGLYIAKDLGAFERQGLNVEISTTGGDENTVAAVVARQAEFGVGDPTFAAVARQRGQDVRVVASVVNGAPFWGVTFDPAVAERYRQNGLRGLTVATFPSPSTAYVLQEQMFRQANLTPSIREGAFGGLLPMVRGEGRRAADIALELEPNVSVARAEGAQVLYSLAQIYGDFAVTGVTVRADFATENPDTVQKFCAALAEAFETIRTRPELVVPALRRRFPDLSEETIREAMQRVAQENVIPRTPVIDPEAWNRALQARAAAGDIEDMAQARAVLDSSYAQAATGETAPAN